MASEKKSKDELPHDRIEDWDDDDIHRIRVSPRMLNELFSYGVTTSAGTSEFGPELLVLEYEGDSPRGEVLEALEAVRRLAPLAKKAWDFNQGES